MADSTVKVRAENEDLHHGGMASSSSFYLVSERGLQKKGLVVRSGCKPPGVLERNTVFWQGGLQLERRQMAFFCKPV